MKKVCVLHNESGWKLGHDDRAGIFSLNFYAFLNLSLD